MPRRPPAARRNRKLYLSESLESRLLLVTFTVNGTAGNDTISLDVSGGNVVITLNGSPQTMSDATVTDIVINGLGGNDAINVIRNSNNPTTVNGGGGDDTIVVQNTSNLGATLTADGGLTEPTLDSLEVNAVTSGDLLVHSTSLFAGINVHFPDIESVTVNELSSDTFSSLEFLPPGAGDVECLKCK
jgi:hypothetical protein